MTSQTTEQIKAIIARNIRCARDERGLSQRQLSVLMGVGEMQVSRWERGVVSPSHSNLTKLAAALELDAGWFYIDRDEEIAA